MRGLISPEFVEEQRAPVRLPNHSRFIAVRAGETSTNVAEQFGLEEGFRNSAAIDGDEGTSSTRALVVNRTRNDFFADSSLPEDQHLRATARGHVDASAQRNRRVALAEQYRRSKD
jgi:hypothetical protein